MKLTLLSENRYYALSLDNRVLYYDGKNLNYNYARQKDGNIVLNKPLYIKLIDTKVQFCVKNGSVSDNDTILNYKMIEDFLPKSFENLGLNDDSIHTNFEFEVNNTLRLYNINSLRWRFLKENVNSLRNSMNEEPLTIHTFEPSNGRQALKFLSLSEKKRKLFDFYEEMLTAYTYTYLYLLKTVKPELSRKFLSEPVKHVTEKGTPCFVLSISGKGVYNPFDYLDLHYLEKIQLTSPETFQALEAIAITAHTALTDLGINYRTPITFPTYLKIKISKLGGYGYDDRFVSIQDVILNNLLYQTKFDLENNFYQRSKQ